MRFLSRFALVPMLVVGCVTGSADDVPRNEERSAEAITAGAFYVFEAKHSGKALDLADGSAADGANVQQWWKNGSTAQQWRLDDAGDGYFVIRSRASGKVLDVAEGSLAEGANVQQWSYGSTANQQWKLEDAGGGYYRVRARHSGMYLDVSWGSAGDGANVAVVGWYASDAQLWKISPVEAARIAAGEYTIEAAHSGKCLDVPGSSTADGAKIQQWSCNGTNAQRFRVTDVGGAFSIVNVGSGKALDISDASTAAGAPVHQWGYGGGANQRFAIEPAADGTHRITAQHSGQSIDVFAASANDGAPLVQWPYDGGANQRFRFVPAGPTTETLDGYRLVWSDEFDRDGLPDESKWTYDVGGGGWGNKEAQFYTDRRAENARVEGGRLIIEARREGYGGMPFTSARLKSKDAGNWLYGRFETRARIPRARGTWAAVWMLPTDWKYGDWPASGEIDIMEHVGWDPTIFHGSVHTGAYNHTIGTQKTARTQITDAFDEFHVYTCEWTPENVSVIVDGRTYFSFANEHADSARWPFDQRFHLILNIAVGGDWGGVRGIDDGAFPQRMEVDWVRAYQR